LKLLITGATGLVGSEIVKICLANNYTVHYLTTQKTKIVTRKNYKGFYWNPLVGEIDVNCLKGINAIINLAGASVAEKWTSNHKVKIRNSRLNSVKLLHQLLSENTHNVTHFCSASALGIYPSSLTEKYGESNVELNSTFLGKVVHDWEKEVDKINELNISVSKLRIGIVFSKRGSALQQMAKPIKLGFGAAIGNGKQFQSWIHISDLAQLFLFILNKNLEGSYNAVTSNPITNLELTRVIAKQIKKPVWLPNIPNFVLKILLGEMSALALESQYLRNDKIKNKGFVFEFDTIEKALQNCLN